MSDEYKSYGSQARNLYIADMANRKGISLASAEKKYGNRDPHEFWYRLAWDLKHGSARQLDEECQECPDCEDGFWGYGDQKYCCRTCEGTNRIPTE